MSLVGSSGVTPSFGKYNVLCRWAAGGMAEIYIARQSGAHGFDKVVALKLLRPELAGEGGFREMFFAEARTGALLSHPNIVQTFDVGEIDGHVYMAMEFVNGESLSRVSRALKKDGPFPIPLALSIVRDIAAALDYAHTLHDLNGEPLHLVHRDVSPSNVMLTHDGAIKLLDFGIAKVATEVGLTQAGAIKGKFSYLSPEQARSEKLDGRSDVFSLGIVAWQLFTGERAFQGENEMALLNAIVNEDLRLPSSTGAEVSPDLDELIMNAVRRNRDERYENARQMSDAFSSYLSTHYPGYSASADIRKIMKEHFGKRAKQLKRVIATAGNRATQQTGDVNFDPQDAWSLPSLSPVSMSMTGATSGPSRTGPSLGRPMTGQPGASGRSTGQYGVEDGSGPSQVSGLIGYSYAGAYAHEKKRGMLPLILGLLLLLGAGGAAAWYFTRTAPDRVVSVTSEPDGAEVQLDGKDVGKTPVEVVLAAGKPANIVVQKRGYIGFQKAVKSDEELSSVHAVLEAAEEFGTLVVQSSPSGAAVLIDGKPVEEVTPIVLSGLSVAEAHTVVVTLDGYAPAARDVRFDKGNSLEIKVDLEATKHAFVAARCEPKPCDVIINGTMAGKTPVDNHSVAAGVDVSVQLMQGSKYVLNEKRTLTAGQLEVFEYIEKAAVHEKVALADPSTPNANNSTSTNGANTGTSNDSDGNDQTRKYYWRVNLEPGEADVFEGSKRVCAGSPCRISHTTSMQRTIKVKAKGYKEATAILKKGGGVVSVTLKEEKQTTGTTRLD